MRLSGFRKRKPALSTQGQRQKGNGAKQMGQQNIGNPSIHDAATVCKDLFEDLLDQCTQSSHHDGARYDEATELFRRFDAWATRVGAVAPPKVSLDARLVDRPDFIDRILELLAMMLQNIRKGITVYYTFLSFILRSYRRSQYAMGLTGSLRTVHGECPKRAWRRCHGSRFWCAGPADRNSRARQTRRSGNGHTSIGDKSAGTQGW